MGAGYRNGVGAESLLDEAIANLLVRGEVEFPLCSAIALRLSSLAKGAASDAAPPDLARRARFVAPLPGALVGAPARVGGGLHRWAFARLREGHRHRGDRADLGRGPAVATHVGRVLERGGGSASPGPGHHPGGALEAPACGRRCDRVPP